MIGHSDDQRDDVIQGQILRRGARGDAILFLHDGALWVADGSDGGSTLVEALTWVRRNCYAPERLERPPNLPGSPQPLSVYELVKIRALIADGCT